MKIIYFLSSLIGSILARNFAGENNNDFHHKIYVLPSLNWDNFQENVYVENDTSTPTPRILKHFSNTGENQQRNKVLQEVIDNLLNDLENKKDIEEELHKIQLKNKKLEKKLIKYNKIQERLNNIDEKYLSFIEEQDNLIKFLKEGHKKHLPSKT